ncbi:hypothetical protein BDW02DRAFT_565603 [Decorospora gaudefroyi]|uniref:Uncharacterized protein n=1 Tax=Decorospora gaudefroyi TaxID=184978 RepID=A0A6A5KW63_9PLEO|nr:hypothetical protein BDW02DRAFT_565603 [Decorospora gaudefroyi]
MATILQTAGDVVDSVGQHIHHTSKKVGYQLEDTTNRILPPSDRQQMVEKLRVYAHQNPKTTAFLATQAAVAGLPLILFLAFAATTLLVSLSTCLLLGLLAALAFSFLVLGFALLFVVPTVFVASCSATFIFIWGFVGYVILRRLNEGEAPAKPGTRVGDKLKGLTGGRSALWFGRQTSAQGHSASGESNHDGNHVDHGSVNQGRVGGGGDAHPRVSAHRSDGGVVNGVNGATGSLEWERKWANGVQTQPVVLETENTFEVLKAEKPVS